jgi:hypothetical protein
VLTSSVKKYNYDKIPFYVSCPESEIAIFKDILSSDDVVVISDEDIIANKLESNINTQQLIKSRFWKTGLCDSYLCLDSDSQFIRPFRREDFLYNEDVPYTLMHECKDLLQAAVKYTDNVYNAYNKTRMNIQAALDRDGRCYDFGPSPYIWDKRVWKLFEEKVLPELGMTFEEVLEKYGNEALWYGETLLIHEPIKLVPIEPLFKVFHYPFQYKESISAGVTLEHLSQNFLGIVLQSNWEAPLHYGNNN